MDHSTKRPKSRAPSEGFADFQAPQLTALGRVTDLTKDFETPGSDDFTMTGFAS